MGSQVEILITLARINLAAAGTAQALSASKLVTRSLFLEADASNAGNIYIGDSTVDSTNGITLAPGQTLNLTGDNMTHAALIDVDLIFMDGDTTNDDLRVNYLKQAGNN